MRYWSLVITWMIKKTSRVLSYFQLECSNTIQISIFNRYKSIAHSQFYWDLETSTLLIMLRGRFSVGRKLFFLMGLEVVCSMQRRGRSSSQWHLHFKHQCWDILVGGFRRILKSVFMIDLLGWMRRWVYNRTMSNRGLKMLLVVFVICKSNIWRKYSKERDRATHPTIKGRIKQGKVHTWTLKRLIHSFLKWKLMRRIKKHLIENQIFLN